MLAVALFIAETEWPIALANDDFNVQVDARVASMQGSILRQICYLVVLCIGIFFLSKAKSRLATWRTPLGMVFAAIIAWSMLSVSWSEDPSTAAKRLMAYLFMATGAAGASALWSQKQILQYISYSGAAALIFGIVAEVAIGGFAPWYGDYRFGGGLHANVQGICCVVLIVSSLAMADISKNHKLRFKLITLLGVSCLVLTKARSCLLGMALAFLIYTFYTRSTLTKIWTAITITISLLALYMTGVLTQVTNFLSRNGEGLDSLTGRKPLWDFADLFIRERPWTGFGFHSFWTVTHVDVFSHEFGWPIGSAHNAYLEMLLNLGYVGMTLHIAILVLGVVLGGYYYKETRSPLFAAASALYAALMVIGMFESAELTSPGPYNFAVTLFAACLCQFRLRSTATITMSSARQVLA